jgi:hypothetical protein
VSRRRRRKSIFDAILDDLADLIDDAYEEQIHAHDSPQTTMVNPLTVEENQLYIEIVELGFREAIKKYHPDREGGDAEKAACINALRDKIHSIAGVRK